jgi:hypothetical protein
LHLVSRLPQWRGFDDPSPVLALALKNFAARGAIPSRSCFR